MALDRLQQQPDDDKVKQSQQNLQGRVRRSQEERDSLKDSLVKLELPIIARVFDHIWLTQQKEQGQEEQDLVDFWREQTTKLGKSNPDEMDTGSYCYRIE